MKKTFWKNSLKSIKDNISRFIAMISIILLSSAVITGLLVSAPNMQRTMTHEYNKYNTADLQLISDIGFDEKSIDIIQKLSNNFRIEGVNIFDKQASINNKISISSLLYEIDFHNNNVNMLNILDEGKLPENEYEILAERSTYYIEPVRIGDVVTIDSKHYKVSGIVSNTWYFSKEAERSVLSSNAVKGIYYKQINNIKPTYSNIFININKDETINHFDKNYDNLISDYSNLFTDEVNNELIEHRLANISKTLLSKDNINIYLLNRSSNNSYQMFKTFVNKVSTITQIFPLFFLIVSILVVLTTMSRMIEEERLEIGTLRSLGYSKKTIYFKYILYAFIVGILGVGVGYATGFRLIPSIVNDAFASVFYLEPLNLDIYSLSNIIYLVFIILSIILTSIFAVKNTLKKNVAALLLPKSPKYGTRIFLEKIPFIWNRLKFKYKSSLRNLFRYPKHFLMTVIGISGSLALIITGIGLINSISAVTKIQYEEIYLYDFTIDISSSTIEFEDLLNSKYSNHIYVYETTYMVTTKTTEESIYVNVIVTDNPINEYINLRTRKKHKELHLTNEGVIISEQLASYMELNIGDVFDANKTHKLKIDGITENYLNNYVYMTKEYYNNNFNEDVEYNKILVKDKITSKEVIEEEILSFDNVLNTNLLTDEIISKDRLLNQVIVLAIVIVLAAIFLAVVVIYNLTNVNISEREKELTTLKVLGYNYVEVSSYIFREINIMTLFGIIVGSPLGLLLHTYVINSIEEPNMMMGKGLKWYAFVISIILTLVVNVIIQLFMKTKIRKIDMISALKEL